MFLHGIIFSKDRAFQLEQLLRSWDRNVIAGPDVNGTELEVFLSVLWTTSSKTECTDESYTAVMQAYPNVTFIQEQKPSGFGAQLLSLVESGGSSGAHTCQKRAHGLNCDDSAGLVMLMVDDMVFYDQLPLRPLADCLLRDTQVLSLHPRLHPAVRWSHPASSASPPPPLHRRTSTNSNAQSTPPPLREDDTPTVESRGAGRSSQDDANTPCCGSRSGGTGGAAAGGFPEDAQMQAYDSESGEEEKEMTSEEDAVTYVFNRSDASGDWDYPWDLCGGLYRIKDAYQVIRGIQARFGPRGISHPNKLEFYGNRLYAQAKKPMKETQVPKSTKEDDAAGKKAEEVDAALRIFSGSMWSSCLVTPVLSVVTINRVQTCYKVPVYASPVLLAPPPPTVTNYPSEGVTPSAAAAAAGATPATPSESEGDTSSRSSHSSHSRSRSGGGGGGGRNDDAGCTEDDCTGSCDALERLRLEGRRLDLSAYQDRSHTFSSVHISDLLLEPVQQPASPPPTAPIDDLTLNESDSITTNQAAVGAAVGAGVGAAVVGGGGPKFILSVLMPVRDAASFVGEAVGSVLEDCWAADLTDYCNTEIDRSACGVEVVVIDDGSIDESFAEAEGAVGRFMERASAGSGGGAYVVERQAEKSEEEGEEEKAPMKEGSGMAHDEIHVGGGQQLSSSSSSSSCCCCYHKLERRDKLVIVVVLLRLVTPRGLVAVLQEGCRRVRAPLVARMDADDIWISGRLKAHLRAFHRNPDMSAVGGAIRVFKGQHASSSPLHFADAVTIHPLEPALLRWGLWFSCCVAHPAVTFRMSAVEAVGGYRDEAQGVEDYDLWLRLACGQPESTRHGGVSNVPQLVLLHRRHANNATAQTETSQARRWAALKAVVQAMEAVLFRKVESNHARTLRDPASGECVGDYAGAMRLLEDLETEACQREGEAYVYESLHARDLVRNDATNRIGEIAVTALQRFGSDAIEVWQAWAKRNPQAQVAMLRGLLS